MSGDNGRSGQSEGEEVGFIGYFRCRNLVTIERWTIEHCAFAVETLFTTNDSMIRTIWQFRLHFDIFPRGPIPFQNTILLGVQNFSNVALGATKTRWRSSRTTREPANIEAI